MTLARVGLHTAETLEAFGRHATAAKCVGAHLVDDAGYRNRVCQELRRLSHLTILV